MLVRDRGRYKGYKFRALQIGKSKCRLQGVIEFSMDAARFGRDLQVPRFHLNFKL